MAGRFSSVLAHVGAPHGHHGGHAHAHARPRHGARQFAWNGDQVVEVLVPVVVDDQDAETGAVERRNPLPIGRYWVDVFAKDSDAFTQWTKRNTDRLKIRGTEHFANDDAALVRDWMLFEVLSPVPWEGPGFPTVADASVTSSSDTSDRPPPPPAVVDQMQGMLDNAAHEIGDALKTGVIVSAAVGVGILILSKMGGKRR
jgi:hypothetical protein